MYYCYQRKWNIKKYSDMMTDQLNYSVRSQRIEDSILFNKHIYFLDKILPNRNMTSKRRRIDVDVTSYCRPCDVITSHRIQYDVTAMLCARWVKFHKEEICLFFCNFVKENMKM